MSTSEEEEMNEIIEEAKKKLEAHLEEERRYHQSSLNDTVPLEDDDIDSVEPRPHSSLQF